jgi:hypothetical protein
MAEREAARIPWRQLQDARDLYVEREAFTFWIRGIESAEGHVPQWLARAVERRCSDFLDFFPVLLLSTLPRPLGLGGKGLENGPSREAGCRPRNAGPEC